VGRFTVYAIRDGELFQVFCFRCWVKTLLVDSSFQFLRTLTTDYPVCVNRKP